MPDFSKDIKKIIKEYFFEKSTAEKLQLLNQFDNDLRTAVNNDIEKSNELITAYNFQIKNGWTFYNEWELTMNTFHNRFNFLLLAYSLFINTYFWANNNNDKLTILIIGFIIIILLSIALYRNFTRHKILMSILHNLDEKDVLPIINSEYRKKRIYNIFPRSLTTGFLIPIIMLLSFIVIGIILKWDSLKYLFRR